MVLVVLEATISRGKRPDGVWVSMVLTSQAHRRRTPKKNRRIPTIPTGRFGGRIVHVSAVDTGPRRSESRVLGDTARRRRGVEPPPQLPPTLRRLPHPAPATWGPICITPSLVLRTEPSPGHLGPITRHQRHDLKHRALSGARAKARKPWFDADPARTEPAPPRSCPESARVGLLHEGRDLLATGCAYCTRAPPTRSTPNPRPVAPHPRAVRPNDASRHPSSCEQPGRSHQRSEQWLPHTVGPPHQRLEMPRHPKLPEDMRQHRG